MDTHQFEQHLRSLGDRLFTLSMLVETNILRETWNLLPIEEKQFFASKLFKKLGNDLIANTISGTIPFDLLFKMIDSTVILEEILANNRVEILNATKEKIHDKVKDLINNIPNDRKVTDLIVLEIQKIVKESYQNVLSFHGDSILKEVKKFIVRVSAEESILKYGATLIQKAKKLVDEEMVKDLVE